MKKLAAIVFVSLLSLFSFSQERSEFKVQKNGLIYGDSTMSKLKNIVDSLNLQFRTCDLNQKFYSKYQTMGYYVDFKGLPENKLKKDLEDNISIESFKEKYPEANVSKKFLIVRWEFENYDNEDVVSFQLIRLKGSSSKIRFYKNLEKTKPENLQNWVFDKDNLNRGFYLLDELKSEEMDVKYAEMIAYADCLIDTNATKFKEESDKGQEGLPKNWRKMSLKKQEQLLEDLRSTRVYGFCSMDSRPREHAVNIALLSAETQNWEVFLRAHLDVMNDRFERMSDGSYAWAQRKTYIRELEELNINVLDLIVGISLRMENPATNHYYGDIGRLGRALAETQHREKVENRLFSMLEDDSLDTFNRIIAYYTLEHYIHHLEDEEISKELQMKLDESIKTLPVSK